MSRSSIPQLQDSSGSSVPAPISSKPMVHARPRRYSALIPGSFKTYMAWPGGGGTGPGTGGGTGGGGGEKRSRATLGLTVSQELARAVTKQLKQDEARIAQNTPYTYPREPVDGGGGGGEEEKRNRRKMDHEQRRKTLQMWPGSSMIGLRNTSFPSSK